LLLNLLGPAPEILEKIGEILISGPQCGSESRQEKDETNLAEREPPEMIVDQKPNDGEDLERHFDLSREPGRNNHIFGACICPQAGNREFPGNDEGYHPGWNPVEVDEHYHGRSHDNLVGDGIYQPPEITDLPRLSGNKPVEKIGDGREGKHNGRSDTEPLFGEGGENQNSRQEKNTADGKPVGKSIEGHG